MKILIIGDTHGYHKPIEKILNNETADKIIHTGDLAGGKLNYLTNPKGLDKCIDLLKEANAQVIRGNHDSWMINSSLISKKSKEYLMNLPKQIILENFPEILFQHTMPSGEKQSLPTRKKYFNEMKIMIDKYSNYNIIFHGHSHISSITSQKNNEFYYKINPNIDEKYSLSNSIKSIIDVGIIFDYTPGRLFNSPRYALYDTEKKEVIFKKITFITNN
jgi:putative phosphoesterase